MAWLGKVSLGNFPDLAGAVTKLSESVKNIEKNFDSALGLQENHPEPSEETWRSSIDGKALFDPVMAFMGHKGEENSVEPSKEVESVQLPSSFEESSGASTKDLSRADSEQFVSPHKECEEALSADGDAAQSALELLEQADEVLPVSPSVDSEIVPSVIVNQENSNFMKPDQDKDVTELQPFEELPSSESNRSSTSVAELVENISLSLPEELQQTSESIDAQHDHKVDAEQFFESVSSRLSDVSEGKEVSEPLEVDAQANVSVKTESASEPTNSFHHIISLRHAPDTKSESALSDVGSPTYPLEVDVRVNDVENSSKVPCLNTNSVLPVMDPNIEIEKLKKEMKLMEAALQGAATQAQVKADEISGLMNENEQLKLTIDELKRKSLESESDALREEYHQRVASLERKVYALTKERDTLRREQSRKNDAAALLKEKDEIINQVMAEGEELSKKQASQEATIRKLRAQIRELEEEKQRLNSKIQVEETKVESMKRDKAATEKLLQETIEKSQMELASQKEYYANALNAAKEAEALAEAHANSEARIELEIHLREAEEREATLLQALEELRQTLSRMERQAASKEDMLRRDIDALQKQYQASERRCEELIAQVPESTRPLLRQIEAMQEATARRAEAWSGVERALNSRLQEAEANTASAEERERSMNERLSQTLSRMAVLEAQVSCLRAEQTQLSRSLEKERQRASENRQEYLAAMEAAATHEGHAKQLEDEIKELRNKHKQELQHEMTHKELLEQELERERTARLELERASLIKTSSSDHYPATKFTSPYADNGSVSIRKLSSAGSLSSMDESFFLHASLDSSDTGTSDRRVANEMPVTSYFMKSMTPSTFEASLRQKDGELASYMSRLASLESIRDSLAEELVKMTEQCEKLQAEASTLPSIRAELEALRRRHTAALELMGERDEELEELRADIVDLKEMYREQVDLLVNKIQRMSSSVGNA